MAESRLRSNGLLAAVVGSALLWGSLVYAAGLSPVHLGLREHARGFFAHLRYQLTGIDLDS